MDNGMINHGDLYPDDDDEGKKLHDVQEFLKKAQQIMDNMNKDAEEITEDSEHLQNMKDNIDELKEDPVDNSSAYLLSLDKEHPKQPTFFYSNERDEEEIEYLVKCLIKQMPKATVVEMLHEVFHELDLKDKDLHESIVWQSNKIANDMNKINPAVMQALSDQNRQN